MLQAKTGLAMDVPTSSILLELYIEFLEHTSIINTLIQSRIIAYFRHVDDTQLIYKLTIRILIKICKNLMITALKCTSLQH
jgi:hypothetical protein